LVVTTGEAKRSPRALFIIGGHLALDFANTVDDPDGPNHHDHAGTYPDLVAWSAGIGVLQPDQAEALLAAAEEHPRARSAALKRAHQLRRILIDIFTEIAAINSGQSEDTEPASSARWIELRPFVTDAVAYSELASGDSAYQLTWPEAERLDAMLWPVAVAASELLTSPQLSRLKKCAGCPWLFLDQSKNLSRRWCTMEDCGTHEKILRYVARRASKRRSS
jgi:predicted RNA-binding Zn ribbon-like protein